MDTLITPLILTEIALVKLDKEEEVQYLIYNRNVVTLHTWLKKRIDQVQPKARIIRGTHPHHVEKC